MAVIVVASKPISAKRLEATSRIAARVRSDRSCCGGRRTARSGVAFLAFDETEGILVF
jgi:hypothetical protein